MTLSRVLSLGALLAFAFGALRAGGAAPAATSRELSARVSLAVNDLTELQKKGDWSGARRVVEGLLGSETSGPYEKFFLNNLLWQFILQDDKNPNARTEASPPLQRALELAMANDFATPRELDRLVMTSIAITGTAPGPAVSQAQKVQDDAKQVAREMAALQSAAAAAPRTPATPVRVYPYVAIVVDTSKSMRDPATGRLLDAVVQSVRDTLALFPSAASVVVDADGTSITPASFNWVANMPTMQSRLLSQLPAYPVESGKDPSKGLIAVLRSGLAGNTYICVIGDEWTLNSDDPVAAVARNNPAGNGSRLFVRIGAIQVPTFGIGASTPGSRTFQSYMARIAEGSGGGVTVLDANAMRQVSAASAADPRVQALRNVINLVP